LELLCCPNCQGGITLQEDSGRESPGGESLFCARCNLVFPIENNIARFVELEEIEGLNRRFARFYDWFARFYPFLTKVGMLGFGGDRRARKVILDRLELGGGRLLEVSIGSGANLPYLFESPNAGGVYGLDISARQLASCSSLAARRGWSVDLFLGTAEALPFKSGSFDSILHIGGINFFSDRKQAIDEMIRVARPGSKIVIADESEEVARMISRVMRVRRSSGAGSAHPAALVDLVPDAMKEIRVDGIWKAHGKYHGYCLEFRKPA
jgi:ubiquinone/menaquinone biosynthesis C-methylase UbiE